MKEKRKRQSSRNLSEFDDNAERYYDNSTGLDDYGLEPPKIYRQAQKKYDDDIASFGTQKRKNITTAEKRSKQTKKRKTKNKARRIATGIIIGVLCLVVICILAVTFLFKITDISVKGTDAYSKQEIIDTLSIKVGDSLFLSNYDDAKAKLETELPYIYDAQFKFGLSSKVEINIIDAVPSYCIRNKNKTYTLLDDNFKVLETASKKGKGIKINKADVKSAKPGNIIVFKSKKVTKCLIQLADAVKANNFTEITAIYSLGLNDNYVVYDNRITFKLGSCDKLEKKLYQGLAACEKLNESNPNAKGEMNIPGDKQIYFTEK